MSRVERVKNIATDTTIKEARGDTDTVRLWENYREQAAMWRAIALFQMPTTFLLVVFSLILWVGRSTTLHVPSKPLPGLYLAKEIPDTEFIEFSTTFVNLISTYQPAIARRQFEQARGMLKEPMLSQFEQEMMQLELKAIETTARTQLFFIDPVKTKVTRLNEKEINVEFIGERQKIIAGRELPSNEAKYVITLSTLPRNTINPYGIVITNALFEQLK